MKRNMLFVFALLVASVLLLGGCGSKSPSSNDDNPSDEPDGEYQLSDFAESKDCARCHPNHYNEWEGSMMAYAALDPAFTKMQGKGQDETNQKLDQFCIQCHLPILSKLGMTPPYFDLNALPPMGREGVSCIACHTISEVTDLKNAQFKLDPKAGIAGQIKDPAPNAYHKSVYSPLFESSNLCGACHNVVNPNGVTIENTYNEWQTSPSAAAGKQCQDCHMPAYSGPAALGGPERTVHRHYFVGVDVALIDFPDRAEQRAMVTELLQSAAEIKVEAPDNVSAGGLLPITVHITSKTSGHNIPTGAIGDRQMWLAVSVTDRATGDVIFQSGHLDANGDLMDRHSEIAPSADYDLVAFGQQMVGKDGNDVFFPWQAFDERTITLPPLATVSPVYSIFMPQEIAGPLQVQVRLRFRTFPPHIFRKIGLDDLAETIPIVDMAEWSGEVAVQ